MSEQTMNMWFFLIFFPMIAIIFRALMAVDYSKIFRKNRIWEIRLIFVILSIVLAFLTAEAFVRFISVIASFF